MGDKRHRDGWTGGDRRRNCDNRGELAHVSVGCGHAFRQHDDNGGRCHAYLPMNLGRCPCPAFLTVSR